MSKKIISAILTIAMIASMFTMVFVTPASAATNYKADVDAIKTAVETVLIKGLRVSDEMLAKLAAAGLIVYDKDATPKYPILKQRLSDDAGYYIKNDASYLAQTKVVEALAIVDSYLLGYTTPTTAVEAVEDVLQFAIYAYTFGQEADSEAVDASFNGAKGRQQIYKLATSALGKLMDGYKAEVGTGADKPASYATAWDEYFYFATKNYYYNSSYGINPYYFLNEIDNSAYKEYYTDTYYNQYLQLGFTSAVKWYSFDEIRANSEWAALLAKFELALRTSLGNQCKDVLYYDFKNGVYTDLNGTFKELCAAIVGTNDHVNGSYVTTVDATAQGKAFTKLAAVLHIYELYIKDISNNMYTTAARDLISNALIAARVVEYVKKDSTETNPVEALKILALDAEKINALADAIIAGLDALVPVYGQELTSTELTAGVSAVKKADSILAAYPQTDANKALRNELIAAKQNLANMLPTTAGAQTRIAVAANTVTTFAYPYKDDASKYQSFKIASIGNDEFNVKFAPTVFAYLIYSSKLAKAYNDFYNYVNTWSAGSNQGVAVSVSKDKLNTVLSTYDFLVGGVFSVNSDTGVGSFAFDEGYLYALTGLTIAQFEALRETDVPTSNFVFEGGFYALILGSSAANLNGQGANPSEKDNAYDAAIRNFIGFYTVYDAGVNAFNGTTVTTSDIGLANGATDYEGNDPLIFLYTQSKGKYDAAADAIVEALKYLTADLTVYINIIRYVVDDIANSFALTQDGNNNYVQSPLNLLPADGMNPIVAANYPNKYFENFVKKINTIQDLLARYSQLLDADKNPYLGIYCAIEKNIVTAYDAMIAQLKTLTTDKGDACIDSYLKAIEEAINIKYGMEDETYVGIYDKLQATQTYIATFLPLEAIVRGYEYFAFTLASVAVENKMSGNFYAMEYAPGATKTKFELNYLDPLKAALANIKAVNTNEYSREACKNAATLAALVEAILAKITLPTPTTDGSIAIDMPVWYAENLLKALQSFKADNANEHVNALAAKKTAELAPILSEAEAMNISLFNVAASEEYTAIWANFQKAYEAARAIQFDKYASVAEIDAAIAALRAGIDAVNNIKKEVKSTDYIYAAIDEANAFIAYVNGTLDTTKLEAVITKVEKALQYNIDVIEVTAGDALVAEIEAAVDAVGAMLPSELISYIASRYSAVFYEQADNKYTEESFNKFVEAYEAAKLVAKNPESKLADILAAKEAFDAADKALAEPTAPVEPERSFTYKSAVSNYNYAVSYLNSLNKADYTEESYNALVAAIEALKTAIESNANDLYLQNAIVNFNVALAQLTAPAAEVPEVPTLDD